MKIIWWTLLLFATAFVTAFYIVPVLSADLRIPYGFAPPAKKRMIKKPAATPLPPKRPFSAPHPQVADHGWPLIEGDRFPPAATFIERYGEWTWQLVPVWAQVPKN